MNKRLGVISIILAISSIFIIFDLKNCPIANAVIFNNNNNNNNPENSVELKIPLPFNSHIASQTIDNNKKYVDNILPFP
jgi:hypothetical protein